MKIFGKKSKIFVLMHFFLFLMKCVLTTKLVIIQKTHHTGQYRQTTVSVSTCTHVS